MLKRLIGTRRIRYRGNDYYLMDEIFAAHYFPYCVSEMTEYQEGKSFLVVINGTAAHGASNNGNDNVRISSFCASSADGDIQKSEHKSFSVVGSFYKNDQLIQVPYVFPQIVSVMADLVLISHDDFQSSHDYYFGDMNRHSYEFKKVFLDYMRVELLAQDYLWNLAAISIMDKKITDYEEAQGNEYIKKYFVTKWGEGEEMTNALRVPLYEWDEIPLAFEIRHKDNTLLTSLAKPEWEDVPYTPIYFKRHGFPNLSSS
jgi:hypothetical protein